MQKDDLREQLVMLLMQKGFGVEGATIAADHLIAHGVTIQRWIPDAEQTPEEDPETGYIDVAVLTKGGKIQIATWDGSNYYIEISSAEDLGDTITHWAYLPPLPEAPKGVE